MIYFLWRGALPSTARSLPEQGIIPYYYFITIMAGVLGEFVNRLVCRVHQHPTSFLKLMQADFLCRGARTLLTSLIAAAPAVGHRQHERRDHERQMHANQPGQLAGIEHSIEIHEGLQHLNR